MALVYARRDLYQSSSWVFLGTSITVWHVPEKQNTILSGQVEHAKTYLGVPCFVYTYGLCSTYGR